MTMTVRNGSTLPSRLEALLAMWRDRCRTGVLPHVDAFVDLAPWQNHLALIDSEHDGYRIRWCGLGLIRRLGREATGECVGNLAPDIAAGLADALGRAVVYGTPVVRHPHVGLGHDRADAVDLILPLTAENDRTVLLFASYEIVG